MRDYEHTPLYDIQRWGGFGGQALFDSIIVFENYPIDRSACRNYATKTLRFGTSERVETTNYPLTLLCMTGDQACDWL